jgi:hypothetical protein
MSLRNTFSTIAIVVFSGLTVASAGFAQDSSAQQGQDEAGDTNSTPQGHGVMGGPAEMMNMMRQMTRMMENCNRMMESAEQNPASAKEPPKAQTPPG